MTQLVFYLLVFVAVGSFFLFIHLVMGRVFRPEKPQNEKLTIYECGEPTVGSAWIQFDLRYYVVALLFVVFDVEVAFFFPWAVVFGDVNKLAQTPADQHEARQEIVDRLKPNNVPVMPVYDEAQMPPETAHAWAWVAFGDIMVFFGVLMVGFAYLWRRGDINWVRSIAPAVPAVSEELPSPDEPHETLVPVNGHAAETVGSH